MLANKQHPYTPSSNAVLLGPIPGTVHVPVWPEALLEAWPHGPMPNNGTQDPVCTCILPQKLYLGNAAKDGGGDPPAV